MGTTIRPIIAGAERRPYQRHALSFKRELVALTLVPGASVVENGGGGGGEKGKKGGGGERRGGERRGGGGRKKRERGGGR